MPDIAAILDQVKARERTVLVCLRGDLAGEAELLQAELDSYGDGWTPTSMGDVDPRRRLGERLEAIREEMREDSVEFRFRALGHTGYSGLIAAHPAPEGSNEPYDAGSFLPALLAMCCTDPVMTASQARSLLDRLSDGQAQELFAAAQLVNEEPSPIPFS